MEWPLPERTPDALCPQCGHAEADHVFDPPYECQGWAHCTIGNREAACECWRAWPGTSGGEFWPKRPDISYRATLRPDTASAVDVEGLDSSDALDRWLSEHGRPGDRFRYLATVNGERTASGQGRIHDDGEPGYMLGPEA